MKLPARLSVLFFIGGFVAGSSALGYYYYFVYSPPLKAAEHFMADMEKQDQRALRADIIVSKDIEEGKLHEPTDFELRSLLSEPFQRGRILDQRKYEGKSRDIYYLVYREPDGRVYALMVSELRCRFRVVIAVGMTSRRNL